MTGPPLSGKLGTRPAWSTLVMAGVAWLVFAMVVLQFNLDSAWSLGLAAGLLLILGAFSHLLNVRATPRWWWLQGALAVTFFVTGMTALVWPDLTYLALTRIIAWFLLFKGTAEVFLALVDRAANTLWWLLAVIGLLEIAVSFGIAGVPEQSIPLLALWVGLIALAQGVTDLVQGLGLRAGPAPAVHARGAPPQQGDMPLRDSSWGGPPSG